MPEMKTLTVNGVKYDIRDANARSNTWLPTIEEIGAAPAGYGLGDKCITVSSWDEATKNGFYYCDYWFGYVTALDNGNISQECFGQFSGIMHKRFRWYCDGSWSEWEWVNPRMIVGEEYRTIERYNGKPVYVKVVDCGNVPNAASKDVAYTTDAACRPFSVIGLCGDGYDALYATTPLYDGSITVDVVNYTYIRVCTTIDRSNMIARAIVKYWKTTD